MKNQVCVVGLSVLALVLGGCATPSNSGDVYTAGQTQTVQTVRMGVVEQVRNVTIDKNSDNNIGALGGGALGAIAASSGIGQGRGELAAGVAGALIGGMVGDRAQAALAKKPGLEITVKLDKSGETIAIVQDADQQFQVGDKVRILSSGGVTRVTH